MSGTPFVYKIQDNRESLMNFRNEMLEKKDSIKSIILDYPTVYIHCCQIDEQYEVYVGETSNIIKRTCQHYDVAKNETKDSWQKEFMKKSSELFIIGYEHFNKSLTLDIENKLMLYLTGVKCLKKIYNTRGNDQNKYYTSDEMNRVFSKVWRLLNSYNAELFSSEGIIKDSALYKASPLHKLTDEQYEVKGRIIETVRQALRKSEVGQVVFIAGEAGTGKSVLISSLFYDLVSNVEELDFEEAKCYLLVNHDEQLVVYQQIAEKLGLNKMDEDVVCKPTHFINTHPVGNMADVILVDEAHLLWTQGKQAYRGKNQLEDIKVRAKVVIVIFDEKQILRAEQYWEAKSLKKLEIEAKANHSYFELKEQLRMKADKNTVRWIRDFIDKGEIAAIPQDSNNYKIIICDTPNDLQKEIEKKASKKKTSLSRLIATFDWAYNDKKVPPNLQKYWEVSIGKWKLPWNKQLQPDKKERKQLKTLAWAEKPYTIGEVGSTYTIQGFDLNYAGVILGPSVKYRDNQVVLDWECSENRYAVQKRTMSDGSKQRFAEFLLRNEINVLLTRGVNGVYIYAHDDELRAALKKASMADRDVKVQN